MEALRSTALDLLEETFETHHGIFIDRGTSLFETLVGIDAASASRRAGPATASIAAHVAHTIFYLEVVEPALHGESVARVDWETIWRESSPVTPAEWLALQHRLRATYERVRERMRGLEDWGDEDRVGAVFGIIAHSAYHLGAIRQAFRALS